MRIAILSCFYPYRGGIAQFNANCLNELGLSHDVKAFNFKLQYPEFLFPGKTQYVTPQDEAVKVDSDRVLNSINPISWIITVQKIKKWNPDILIIRYWMPFFAPSLGFVAKRLRKSCKVIGILDNVIPHERRPFDGILTKYFLSGLDGCITLCSEVAEDLKSLQKKATFTVLPHPIYSHFGKKLPRENAERKLGIKPDKKNILFFGLIREYKGLDILLDAFDIINNSNYQLIIAGEPYGSFEKYQRTIDRSPGRDRIFVFPDYVKDSEVTDFFSAADVVVLPYRSATQSGISSVAYHFEVPLIVTDVGGLKETIGDRGTGVVTKEITPRRIAGEILNFFSNPDKRATYIRNIKAEKERLSWSKFCNDLVDFGGTL